MYNLYLCRKIISDLSINKKVSVTATTGMARLQYIKAMTIHHWSGYADGHLSADRLIALILTNPGYAATKQWIIECDVLVIDEVGLLSAKAFDAIELICRSVKGNYLPFGGIQVIAAGSFIQLPPVPNRMDPGLFAFQSTKFKATFPHKIPLNVVVHQDQKELVDAINELCLGETSQKSVDFLKNLDKPIPVKDSTVYIFGTNFNVDMLNHDKLQALPGALKVYYSWDRGNWKNVKLCKASKLLAIKSNARVIIIQNLDNGLVNGLCGLITHNCDKTITVEIQEDEHLKHGMEGKSFTLERQIFSVHDINGDKVAERKQVSY